MSIHRGKGFDEIASTFSKVVEEVSHPPRIDLISLGV
ncbi:MAG: hypothetical protein CM1200mP17_17800 [Woeseia sp.]|nr:MAG: hypothetical protein CM1200mP17_17800 [Woeseia sp.]